MIRITTALDAMPFDAALALVRQTDWHANIPEAVFRVACAHSVCFGALDGDVLVGFARVVTDHATYAYLCDVIVREDRRGEGIARALVDATIAHPTIGALRRYALLTRHAAGLYRKIGFAERDPAISYLERYQPMHART